MTAMTCTAVVSRCEAPVARNKSCPWTTISRTLDSLTRGAPWWLSDAMIVAGAGSVDTATARV
jgi:hypothetical protein